ncbi:hypothetical protein GS634_07950 [Ruegeria atlantica]|uniref:Uncharacterized protein n=1 Tax=Ruegeria atlantica TaxID=81569 RepID=A0AA91BZM9_9RHOB|nr:hypothetical protein [Ruegeria atlantica]
MQDLLDVIWVAAFVCLLAFALIAVFLVQLSLKRTGCEQLVVLGVVGYAAAPVLSKRLTERNGLRFMVETGRSC